MTAENSSDGETSTVYASDRTTVTHSDGSQVVTATSGLVREVDSEGNALWHVPSGPVLSVAPDGTVSATLQGSPVAVSTATDGSYRIDESAVTYWTLDAGTLSLGRHSASGVSWSLDAAGNRSWACTGLALELRGLAVAMDDVRYQDDLSLVVTCGNGLHRDPRL